MKQQPYGQKIEISYYPVQPYILRTVSAVSSILLFLNIGGIIVLTEFVRTALFLLWFCPEVWPGTLWVSRKFSTWNLQRKARKAEAEVSRRILEEERLSL